jgi:hypothetical protein
MEIIHFILFALIPMLGLCTCNLAAVDKECGRNAPGLKTILYLACADDITSIGAATAHAVSTITEVATQGFFPINIIRKDNDLKSTPGEDGGFTTELKGFISKQTAAKSNVLTQFATDENYIAIAVDQNGVQHILGSIDHPIRAKAEPVTTPKNGYNVTLTWEGHSDIPYIYTGAIGDVLHP